MNRLLVIGSVATAALLVAAAPQGPVEAKSNDYEVTILSVPDATAFMSYANSVNDNGRIAGGWWTYDEVNGYWNHAAVWNRSDSDPEELPPLAEGDWTWAAAINDNGEVCGYSSGWATLNAVIWDKNGKVRDCHPDLGYTYSEFLDINHYGDAVGHTWSWDTWDWAFLSPADGTPYLLPVDTTAYFASEAYEISKDCVVVGLARHIETGRVHAAVWDADGNMRDLHLEMETDRDETLAFSRAWMVTDAGELGGVAFPSATSDDGCFAWVWSEGEGFTYVDIADTPEGAIWGGGGKYMVGMVDGNPGDWGGSFDVPVSQAAVWTRGTSKGKTVWDLTALPMLDGYQGMAAISANTSGALVGVALPEGAPDAWSSWGWYAKR